MSVFSIGSFGKAPFRAYLALSCHEVTEGFLPKAKEVAFASSSIVVARLDSLTKRDRSGYRMHECVVVAALVYSRVAIAHKKAHKKKTGKSLFSTLYLL